MGCPTSRATGLSPLSGAESSAVIIALSAHGMAEAYRKSPGASTDDHVAEPLNRSAVQQKWMQWAEEQGAD